MGLFGENLVLHLSKIEMLKGPGLSCSTYMLHFLFKNEVKRLPVFPTPFCLCNDQLQARHLLLTTVRLTLSRWNGSSMAQ